MFGRTVDVVGYSMGGLIIRGAITGTRNPPSGQGWPPYIYAEDVRRLATPHDGTAAIDGTGPLFDECRDDPCTRIPLKSSTCIRDQVSAGPVLCDCSVPGDVGITGSNWPHDLIELHRRNPASQTREPRRSCVARISPRSATKTRTRR
jgi:hypothetical protein